MLNCILGYEDMGAKQGRETLILNAKKHCQGTSMTAAALCGLGHLMMLKVTRKPS